MRSRADRRAAWARAAFDAGDAPAAAVLLDLLERDMLLTPAVAVELVPQVWDRCSAPMRVLDVSGWVAMFRCAGYTHEFVPAELPAKTLRLYRGSDASGELGMCWSSNVDVARWVASKYDEGWVWVADVEPPRLLAFMAATYEDQFVVDTTGLAPVVFEHPGQVAAIDPEELAGRLDALVEIGAAR